MAKQVDKDDFVLPFYTEDVSERSISSGHDKLSKLNLMPSMKSLQEVQTSMMKRARSNASTADVDGGYFLCDQYFLLYIFIICF